MGGHWEESRMLPQFSFLSDRHGADGSRTCSSLRKIRVKWALRHFQEAGHREVKIYKTMASGAGGLPWRAPTLCPVPLGTLLTFVAWI